MSNESVGATPPAPSGDVKVEGSGNLTQASAAAGLFAKAAAAQAAAAKAETQSDKPAPSVTEEIAPEKSEETTPAPVTEAPAASVEPEEEAEAEAAQPAAKEEAEPEEDSVPSQSISELTPEMEAILGRRVAKEVKKTKAMREAMEAKVAELEAKLAAKAETTLPEPAATEPTPPPVAPSIIPGPQPLGNYNDLASLGTLQQQAKSAVRWAEETLDTPKAWKTRVDVDPDTGDETSVRVTKNGAETYTEAQVKAIIRDAKITLEDHIPARAHFVNARQRAQQLAREEFPFLADKKSPEYQQAQQMLRDPRLQAWPDAEYIVGMQIRGMKAIEADKAAKKAAEAPKPKAKAPAIKPSSDQSVVSSTSVVARIPAGTANKNALVAEQQKLKQKGGITTAEAIASLQNRERIRNSR